MVQLTSQSRYLWVENATVFSHIPYEKSQIPFKFNNFGCRMSLYLSVLRDPSEIFNVSATTNQKRKVLQICQNYKRTFPAFHRVHVFYYQKRRFEKGKLT